MKRRSFLVAGSASLLAPALPSRFAIAQTARRTLRYGPSANLTLLDPIWSTAYVSLCHGYAVFDTLYGTDAAMRVKPQMAEGHEISTDGLQWVIRLREGLRFHDGEPVRAADCAASLARWAARQSAGQIVGSFVESWTARDDRTLVVTLKRPFPNLAYVMAVSVFPPFIMPERLAKTDPGSQVAEMVGSGPFRFLAGEYNSGSFAAYEKFAGYVPRQEPPEWTSGGKIAKVDRIEWHVLPEPATAAAALQQGEIDWLERPVADLLALLRPNKDIRIDVTDPTGWSGELRFNHLQPPFNNPAVRRAVMMAVNQDDFMRVAAGDDASSYRLCKAMFPCGTPYGHEIGTAAMPGNLEAARAALKTSGYAGETVVLLNPSDSPPIGDLGLVAADLMTNLGLKVELVNTDWGTVTQRRAKKDPVAQGGWSAFVTIVNGPAIINPAVNFLTRGLGARGYFGWYENAEVERLVGEWLASGDDAERVRLADSIQRVAFDTVPVVPLGQYLQHTAYRRTISGVLKGPAVLPWNVEKAS